MWVGKSSVIAVGCDAALGAHWLAAHVHQARAERPPGQARALLRLALLQPQVRLLCLPFAFAFVCPLRLRLSPSSQSHGTKPADLKMLWRLFWRACDASGMEQPCSQWRSRGFVPSFANTAIRPKHAPLFSNTRGKGVDTKSLRDTGRGTTAPTQLPHPDAPRVQPPTPPSVFHPMPVSASPASPPPCVQ